MLFTICFCSLAVIMLLYSNPVLTGGTFLLGVTIVEEILIVSLCFVNSRTKMPKRGGLSGDAWSSTTPETQCKN